MPTLTENRTRWDGAYDWSTAGDEWSAMWGTTDAEWRWTILPRIAPYIPTGRILEIAPGFGRWTQYLVRFCEALDAVDISTECIRACQQRLTNTTARFHVGDGVTLPLPDESIDFAFSFDSLVHVEIDVLRSYFTELTRVLTPTGVAFIHHSIAGQHRRHFSWWREPGTKRQKARSALYRLTGGLIDRTSHWRAQSVDPQSALRAIADAGLNVISQETFPWSTRRSIDGITVLTKREVKEPIFVETRDFMREARMARRRSHLP